MLFDCHVRSVDAYEPPRSPVPAQSRTAQSQGQKQSSTTASSDTATLEAQMASVLEEQSYMQERLMALETEVSGNNRMYSPSLCLHWSATPREVTNVFSLVEPCACLLSIITVRFGRNHGTRNDLNVACNGFTVLCCVCIQVAQLKLQLAAKTG